MASSPTLAPAPVAPAVPDIVFEHLEETAFLMVQRRRLVFAPEAPQAALARVDARLEAHRDGLAIAGREAARLAEEQLACGDPWLTAAAVRTWIEFGHPTPADVLAKLDAAGDALPWWREGMRGLSPAALERLHAKTAALPESPACAEAVLDARLWQGSASPALQQAAVRHAHAGVRRALARLTRDGGVTAALADDADAGVRERALWNAAASNPRGAAALVRPRANGAEPTVAALRLLGLFGEKADGERLAARLADPARAATAAMALRDLGWCTHANALLPLLDSKDEDTAAAALEAFESLCGPIPPADEANPLPAGTTAAEAHAKAATKGAERRLRGLAFAWPGKEADEPLERRWRRALAGALSEPALAREVPDGIFDGSAPHEARPGT